MAAFLTLASCSRPTPTMPPANPGAAPSALVPTASDVALIIDSGSTNVAGYRLFVHEDGRATLDEGDAPHPRLDPKLVQRFFADLRAAGALDRLPGYHCMKSASFGTTTQVAYRGVMSSDLSCSTGAGSALAKDAAELGRAAGLAGRPRRDIGE